MKQFYSLMLKTVIAGMSFSFSLQTSAQHRTHIIYSNECEVTQNFNDSAGCFTSPSIYSSSDDTEFEYLKIDGNGLWKERSGLATRDASLISASYTNPSGEGKAIVGFRFEAPAGTQYRIRIIAPTCPDVDLAIIATTANGPVWTPLPDNNTEAGDRMVGQICVILADNDIHKNQLIRYEVSFRSTQPGDIVFDDFSLGEVSEAPLPVTFLGLLARTENSGTRLLWDVADEYGVKGYEVERSTDGVRFQSIGFVPAASKASYSFMDGSKVSGTVYYRVKNIDLDGSYKYSSLARIQHKEQSSVLLYPTPAQQTVYVQHPKATTNMQFVISTADGRMVKTLKPASLSLVTNIDVSGLLPGIYLLRVDYGNNRVETVKFLKQ